MSFIGKVVTIEGKKGKYVVLDHKSNEDYGSCSYDREFRIVPLEEIAGKGEIDVTAGEVFKLRGTKFTVHVLEDEAPFELTPVTVLTVRRKTPVVEIKYV